MSVYKAFTRSDINTKTVSVSKTFREHKSNLGVVNYVSASKTNSLSGSYWKSLRAIFYLSGSDLTTNSSGQPTDISKYGNPVPHTFAIEPSYQTPQYTHKFHNMASGSVISISQNHFGNTIQPGSFILSSSTLQIRDDYYGNLYCTNGGYVTTTATSISSSDNYVGNIFYNLGVAVIAETGSVGKYSAFAKGEFSAQYDSSHELITKEYICRIKPNEFLLSNNPTSRQSSAFYPSASQSPYLLNELTSSGWNPFFTTVGFYSLNPAHPHRNKELVMVARYPQPIESRSDMEVLLKVKMDF